MGRTLSVAMRIAGAALLGLGLDAAVPPRAVAASIDLEYDAFVLGFPAVTLDFQLTEGSTDYHVVGSLHTNGAANMVVNYRLETHTDGQVVAGKLRPVGETSQSRRNGVEKLMRLDYDGVTVRAHVVPAPDKMLPPDQIAGTIDPVSAALAAGHTLAATGRCDQRIKVFDGHTRYDLVLTDEGEGRLVRGLGIYAGPAHRCRLDLIKIDEAQHEKSAFKDEPAEVWFASLDPALPPVPVRIDFSSHWGAASIGLTRVRTAAVVGVHP